MPSDQHKKAAQDHDDAAKMHRAAGDHHDKGDYDAGRTLAESSRRIIESA